MALLLGQLGYPGGTGEVALRIDAYGADPASLLLVAEAGGQVVGLLGFHAVPLIHQDGSLGKVTALVVDAAHRRRGIARALLERIEILGIGKGCVRLEVTTNEARAGAHRLYEAAGYAHTSRKYAKDIAP